MNKNFVQDVPKQKSQKSYSGRFNLRKAMILLVITGKLIKLTKICFELN